MARADLPQVAEREAKDAAALDALLNGAREPFVIRGLAAHWPIVEAGRRSFKEARDYIERHHVDRPFMVSVGDPKAKGRMFYDEAMGMNFRMTSAKLPQVFQQIDRLEGQPGSPTIYFASIDLHDFFDGLHEANRIDLGDRKPLASIWMGTSTRIAAHNDFPDNLAVCAVGKRRFTVFPPNQFRNLYLGPVDNTPAGRAISMVDFENPDLDAHPRFADALEHAQVAELEPGDAVFIPSMWWHHVEGLADFNVLINYWWRDTPNYLGQPQNALNHAMLSIRDLPKEDREIWRQLFDYYVFEAGDEVTDHIPDHARSVLGRLDKEQAGRMRAFLLRALSQ